MQSWKTFSLSVFIGLFVFQSYGFSAWVGETSARPHQVKVLGSNPSFTRLDLEFFGFNLTKVDVNGKLYNQVSIPGIRQMDLKGLPALPQWNRNLMIPSGAALRMTVEKEDIQTYSIRDILPSKGTIERNVDPKTVPYTFDKFYATGASYPMDTVRFSASFQLRAAHGVTVSVNPIRIENIRGELQLLRKMVLRIDHRSGDKKSKLLSTQVMDREFAKVYADRFLNFKDIMAKNKVNYTIPDSGKVLVIAHEDFVDGVQPLMNWRRDTGLWHKIVSLASIRDRNGVVTYSQVKALIQSEYDMNQISYVLLVGDKEFLPTHPGSSGNAWGEEADPKYALVAGTDSYPDLFVSRLSVKTAAELEVIVNKTLRYEQEPEIGGQWYGKSTGIASEEGVPKDWERANILRDLLLGWHFTEVDQIYEPDDRKEYLVDALNEGRGFINYLGHGTEDYWVSTGFDNQDILNLRNGERVPVIVSVACVNGDFGYYDDSFAEVWLKAGTAIESKGALAIFASSTNQSWVPPTVGQQEITRLLVNERMRTVGALMFHGSVAVLEDNSSSAAQTFETWHVFGDGNAEIRTQAPTAISLRNNSLRTIRSGVRRISLQVGSGDIRLGVVREQNSRSDRAELIASGVSMPDGTLNLVLSQSLLAGDTVRLTFTGFNRIPLIQEITVQ